MNIRKKIEHILRHESSTDGGDYGVELVSVTKNIQGTYDVELDQNIYYKEQARMEEQIRELGLINDIFYRDVI